MSDFFGGGVLGDFFFFFLEMDPIFGNNKELLNGVPFFSKRNFNFVERLQILQ